MRRLTQKLAYFLYYRLINSHFELLVPVRRALLRLVLNQPLDGLVVRPGVIVSGYKRLVIGRDVSINHNCFLSCHGGLDIGDNVAIGHGTSILTTEHGFGDPDTPIKFQPASYAPVRIAPDVWVGANVTILAGVSIPEGCIVAAGAVVTKSVEAPHTIVGGVPARVLKPRFEQRRDPGSR